MICTAEAAFKCFQFLLINKLSKMLLINLPKKCPGKVGIVCELQNINVDFIVFVVLKELSETTFCIRFYWRLLTKPL